MARRPDRNAACEVQDTAALGGEVSEPAHAIHPDGAVNRQGRVAVHADELVSADELGAAALHVGVDRR